MKIELEVKIDGERFFYDSSKITSLTRGPDGNLYSSELCNAEIDYCRLTIMTTKAEVDFHKQFVLPWLLPSSIPAKGDAQ